MPYRAEIDGELRIMMRMHKMGRAAGRLMRYSALLFFLIGFLISAFARNQPVDEIEPQSDSPGLQKTGRVAVIQIKGGIFQGVAEFVIDAIDRAEKGAMECLVIELDTPGGRLDSTQEIVKRMLSARVPMVVFVSPKGAQAASAGTFVTMAGHLACMAPGTRIGAAHPVFMGPTLPGIPGREENEDQKEENKKRTAEQMEIMMEKATNDTVAFAVGIAKLRGRNQDWAEKAVRESVSITADRAVQMDVVDLRVETLELLLDAIHGRTVNLDEKTEVTLHTRNAGIDRWNMSPKQKLFTFLSDPNVFWLLLLLGIGGLGMEFYHPGSIFPGAIGALCLLLAAISSQVLPLNLGGLVLVLLGIGLMIAEVYVTSYGMLGLGGAVLLVLGGILVVDPASEPHYMDPSLGVDWSVLVPTVVALGSAFLYIGYYVVRSQRRRLETGSEGMLGLVGEARSGIDSEGGRVFVRGELWKAVSEKPIQAGSRIVVKKVEGLRLHVEEKS